MRPADMTDDPWLEDQRDTLAQTVVKPHAQTLGRVERFGDGIAFVSGLPDAALNELLHFESGATGFAHTLDADVISVVLLDDGTAVEAGACVTRSGTVLQVPVGEALLGRVIDPLGRPLDRDDPIVAEMRMPVERPAPAIIERDLVSEPVETGVLLVDALFAIGRGQREAHHRRPCHGQDRFSDRHNRQPEAFGHDLRLCRDRPAHNRRAAGY